MQGARINTNVRNEAIPHDGQGPQRLEGKRVRPDGGYVLELKSVKKDRSLTAAYYNPRPIRVFRAEAAKRDGAITLAVERRTFDVEFMRMR